MVATCPFCGQENKWDVYQGELCNLKLCGHFESVDENHAEFASASSYMRRNAGKKG
jgi:hypothetical protein